MRHILIVDGHPDPSQERLNHALADRYAQAARSAGNDVRRVDVGRLDFPLLRAAEDFYSGTPCEAIREAQRDIAWADHVVFFFPLWVGDMPSLLKAFIEQTFRPGFAMEYGGRRRFPRKLLAGKSARFVVTMGMPAFVYRRYFGEFALKAAARSLGMAGIAPVSITIIGGVGDARERTRRAWLNRAAALGKLDGTAQTTRRMPLRALARTALFLTGAYLAYSAVTWSRYGAQKPLQRKDELLDGAMPDYEVRTRHRVEVDAPASMAFDEMRETGFERFSPIVQALFRLRELLLHARRDERTMPLGLVRQLEALGWTVLSESPGREVVLGTLTQPWRANPSFRSLPPAEFAAFREPGFAKIALTLRVEPISDERCELVTETRVITTDAQSRSRFRRYWALLAPGISLIRVVLLQQVKANAEARYGRGRTPAPRVEEGEVRLEDVPSGENAAYRASRR